MMSKQRNFLLIIMLALLVLSCTQQTSHSGTRISGRQLLVDEQAYQIRGVCYNPVPAGSSTRNFDLLSQDLALMQEAGINTIRLYSPIDDKKVLDKIHQAGIKVITGFGYNQDGYYDILTGSFLDYIEKYKNHPAILFWELGNEYNYHPEWFNGKVINWYNILDKAAAEARRTDPSHPVGTAHGELPDSLALALCHNVDIWGLNVYRWDQPGDIFQEYKTCCHKPMYLSEAGADSYMTAAAKGYKQGPNEEAQAEATRNILEDIMANTEVCSGVCLFSFSDEWWKAGSNTEQDPGGWAPESSGVPYDGAPNEEYWGIVDIHRNKKAAFQVVKEIYQRNNK